jgi:putative SOS response-associated peptidase YedK
MIDMCANYVPVTQSDRLLEFFGVVRDRSDAPVDVWPLGLAPFIRKAEEGSGNSIVEDGVFGLLPYFQAEMAAGRMTYNARSETVATKRSFRDAWKKGQRCIIPAEAIYEPNYESGKAERWRISLPNSEPMGIAGVYEKWTDPNGRQHMTFAMVTVNADGHPVMQRFHKHDDEKRMVVILSREEQGEWLRCSVTEAPRLFKRWEGPLEVTPALLPPKAPKSTNGKVVRPMPPEEPSLF